MSFRKQASGGKRDAAEGPIVDALIGRGCKVCYLSGKGNPDLLVKAPAGAWMPLEVKTGKGGYTANQDPDAWPTVRTPAEALAVVFG